jgi:hypothetical protein
VRGTDVVQALAQPDLGVLSGSCAAFPADAVKVVVSDGQFPKIERSGSIGKL